MTRGIAHDARALPALVAEIDGAPAGLLTYGLDNRECEIVTLDSQSERVGVGTALLNRARAVARDARCLRLWLITTNDNLPALAFYQKRGFTLARLHRDAVAQSNTLKPSIPLVGHDGIPVRDELELEIRLC